MPAKSYRILIADDHALVRRGIKIILSAQPGIEIVGEATTGREAIEQVRKLKPDLVLLDLTMPEVNGLEVAEQIRTESPDTDVLVLTMHFSEEIARDVRRSGALGYVLKSDADTELVSAVERARRHEPYFTSKLALSMAKTFTEGSNHGTREAEEHEGGLPGTPLTGREVEVVRLLAEGKSNKEVASALEVSTRTVESHRNHIMRKMKFRSFSELVRFAIRNSLVEP